MKEKEPKSQFCKFHKRTVLLGNPKDKKGYCNKCKKWHKIKEPIGHTYY